MLRGGNDEGIGLPVEVPPQAVSRQRSAVDPGHRVASVRRSRSRTSTFEVARDKIAAMDAIDWLLDSDPAIRWQTLRDLTDASPAAVAAERARVAREGLGAEILAARARTARGTAPASPTGCRPSSRCSCCVRPASTPPILASPPRWRASRRASGGTSRSARSRSSTARWSRASTAARSRSAPTSDARRRASRAGSSANSSRTAGGTAMRRRARARRTTPQSACSRGCSSTSAPSGPSPEIAEARKRGEEYLLERGLFRRRSTGEVAHPSFLTLAFPPRYEYDVLRALDYFRAAGAEPDPRIDDAVHIVKSRRQADGRWLLDRAHDEALALPVRRVRGRAEPVEHAPGAARAALVPTLMVIPDEQPDASGAAS